MTQKVLKGLGNRGIMMHSLKVLCLCCFVPNPARVLQIVQVTTNPVLKIFYEKKFGITQVSQVAHMIVSK